MAEREEGLGGGEPCRFDQALLAARCRTQLAGSKRLPAEVVQHIVAKTDGVPLYVEELTKMLL